MSEGVPSTSAGQALIELLQEGGLPQVIAGPAGKALSRLIGEAADIPAAWLQRYSQGIRDETKARSLMKSTVAAAASKRAAKDIDILDRTIVGLLGDRVRVQENREKIAEKTYEQLRDEPPLADSVGPSDDWLNFFVDHAGRASSERLQDMWARVLAGEIRKQGEFSFQTLQFISVLDPKIATTFERFAEEFVSSDFIISPDRFNYTDRYNDLLLLQQYGLVIPTQLKRFNFDSPLGSFFMADCMMVTHFDEPKSVDLNVALLTQVGREVYNILSPSPSPEVARSMAKVFIQACGGKSCQVYRRKPNKGKKLVPHEAEYLLVETVPI